MRRAHTLALLTLACLGAPAAAHGATVTVTPPPPCGLLQGKYGQCDPPVIRFAADPGEANRLTVTSQVGRVHFREASVPVRAGSGCEAVSDREASCPAMGPITVETSDLDDTVAGILGVTVNAGAGDDLVTGASSARGGPGNDALATGSAGTGGLYGEEGDDTLTGSGDQDFLYGGGGRDTLTGGAGDDRMSGDATGPVIGSASPPPDASADVLDGGEGTDTVLYDERRTAVVVDLASGTAGAPGEGDRLSAVERVFGGAGSDRLNGDALDNLLVGGRGRDVISGGGGDDVLEGGRGRDTISGDDGDDAIGADTERSFGYEFGTSIKRDGGDQVACGNGRDRVTAVDDLLGPDCESLGISEVVSLIRPHPVRAARRVLTFRVSCPRTQRRRGRCRGTLRAGGRSTRFSIARGGGRVAVRGRRFAGRVRVSLRISGPPGQGSLGARYYIRLG